MPTLVPGVAWPAITGGLAAAKVTVTGTGVQAHCERRTVLTNCMVGTWSSTGVVVDAPSIRLRGGAGVILRIEPEGKATVEFDAMKLLGMSIPFSFPLGDFLNPKNARRGVPQKPFGDAAADCTASTLTRTDASSGISIVWRWKRI
jgi:hypothetical protein